MAASLNFAAELSATCGQIRPDMDKYMDTVKQQCMREARKGHSHAEVLLCDCLSTPGDVQQEAELLGITVNKCQRLRPGSNIVSLRVSWRKQQAHPIEERRKRRRVNESNFVSELSATCGQIRPDMDKYMDAVKRQCMEEARKGHSHAEVLLCDCLSTPKDVQQEAELLGITVNKCERLLPGSKIVSLQVSWPNKGETAGVCQPSGLQSGNLRRVCKICLEEETMCRLHPCGHIIGMECAKALLERPCAFCRQPVRFVHPIFEP